MTYSHIKPKPTRVVRCGPITGTAYGTKYFQGCETLAEPKRGRVEAALNMCGSALAKPVKVMTTALADMLYNHRKNKEERAYRKELERRAQEEAAKPKPLITGYKA